MPVDPIVTSRRVRPARPVRSAPPARSGGSHRGSPVGSRAGVLGLLTLASVAAAVAAPPAHAARLELRLENVPGPFTPGDSITIGVWMTDLGGVGAAGFQAFLEFDDTAMDFVGGVYALGVFGQPIIDPITDVGGTLDLASGIDQPGGQAPTTADARLATLVFEATDTFCLPPIDFRPTTPPTRITNGFGTPLTPLDLIVLEPTCVGDLDFSGQVGFSDLITLLANWGGSCAGDLDGDGDVDFTDLVILLAAWGPCP